MKSREAKRASHEGPWPFIETHSDLHPAEREWLHTNGAGAYSMSTIAMMHTRRHHGAFIATLSPPLGRHVIVSHAETNVTVDEDRRRVYRLATHQFPNVAPTPGYRLLQSFSQDPLPRWVFRLGAHTLERTLCLARGRNAMILGYTWRGRTPARISVRPLMPLRPVAGLMVEHGAMNQVVLLRGGSVEVQPIAELPPIAFRHEGVFMGSPDWWRRFEYLEDRRLGNAFTEDMWTPGVFELALEPGRTAYLMTAVGALPAESSADLQAEAREALLAEDPGPSRAPRVRQLFVAAEQFCADAVQRPVIVAGYPWHAVYTRDLVLSVVGLHLARGRLDLARRALATVLSELHFGLLPETLLSTGEKRPKPVPDATLWLFEVARELRLRLPASDPLLKDQLYPALVRAFLRVSARRKRFIWLTSEGLVANGAPSVALTWMDAHIGSELVTPRRGVAIELQALWTKGAETLAGLAREYGHERLAALALSTMHRARAAFRARFWCHETDYPYDVVSEVRDTAEAWADHSIRPNALIALAIDPELFDAPQTRAILDRVQSDLLTPRGIRSLSPSDNRYIGFFSGTNEEREYAYHQGSGWAYLLGFYVRAALRFSADDSELPGELRALIEGAAESQLLLGQVAQLTDGESPYRSRGCPAQAASVAELLRALVLDLRA
ncbi:MAG TPA: amylo-alpha-1,6-glucosidase [Polyangiaceae bacterium]|nr:amylo-alpha-1,6-glucosidase [Polyangiaceae bacterium]